MTGGQSVDDFHALKNRQNIDSAIAKYKEMYDEILQTLSTNIAMLKDWTEFQGPGRLGCGTEYSELGADAETYRFTEYTVDGKLSDSEYEKALQIIGDISRKYGFDARPQRLHDSTGSHDATFHNTEDESAITFGTDKNTLIGASVGCHLTAEAKKRGYPAGS